MALKNPPDNCVWRLLISNFFKTKFKFSYCVTSPIKISIKNMGINNNKYIFNTFIISFLDLTNVNDNKMCIDINRT